MSLPSSLTPQQEQLLLGTMLGDGHMSRRTRYPSYRSNHGLSQRGYNLRKASILAPFIRTPESVRRNKGFGKWSSVFSTLSAPAFSFIADLCLGTDGCKRISSGWLERLTWEGISWWIGDDGSLAGRRALHLHTEGFSITETEWLAEWLTGLGAGADRTTSRRKDGRVHNYLLLTERGTRFLAEKVRPFMPPEMAHKINLRERLTHANCVYCLSLFEITGTVSRDPGNPPKRGYCCPSPVCRRKRRSEVVSSYDRSEKGKSLRHSWTASKRENLREYNREYARKRRAESKLSS